MASPLSLHWRLNHFRDITLIESSLAVINKARASAVEAWDILICYLSKPHFLAQMCRFDKVYEDLHILSSIWEFLCDGMFLGCPSAPFSWT